MTTETLIQRRARLLGPNVSTFYDQPVHLVRGEGVWVWDADGRQYLDCYNNVPHVGHCHPKVVEAICKQAGLLNTHTRYLHEGILDYIETLTATFADPLSTAILTCTGSEANDIALRMAQGLTGKTGIIATDHTYHGNTAIVSQLSKTNPPPGGPAPNVRYVPAPDSYRTEGEPGAAAENFARAVRGAIDELEATPYGFSGIILCPFFANEGFPAVGPDFLGPMQRAVKQAGGVIIADEVQPGFGRIGSHMWGHQKNALTPDIVTLGKPIANGHPVGAVVTSPEIMAVFRESFRYFNTFGGNPVSCAAARATFDVLTEEGLMENALSWAPMRWRVCRTWRRGTTVSGMCAGPACSSGGAGQRPQPKNARRRSNQPGGERNAGSRHSAEQAGHSLQHLENSAANAVLKRACRPVAGNPGRGPDRHWRGRLKRGVFQRRCGAPPCGSGCGQLERRPGDTGTDQQPRERGVPGAVTGRPVGRPAAAPARISQPAALASELWWISALANKGLPVPAPVAGIDGELLTSLPAGPSGEIIFADMLEWLAGKPLGQMRAPLTLTGDDRTRVFRDLGRVMARLHLASDALTLAPDFTRHAWDQDGLLGPQPFWGRFWECDGLSDEEKNLILAARKRPLPSCPVMPGKAITA